LGEKKRDKTNPNSKQTQIVPETRVSVGAESPARKIRGVGTGKFVSRRIKKYQ